MENLNEIYADHYRTLHERNPGMFPGVSTRHHVKLIGDLINQTGSLTVLDYGCGQGRQYTDLKYHEAWKVDMPTLYDPGVERYKNKPQGRFDCVVCVDVLEHIPEPLIRQVITEICDYADKFVFLVIAQFLAGELLPDGTNAHVSIFEDQWWIDRIKECNHRSKPVYCLFRKSVEKFNGGWI